MTKSTQHPSKHRRSFAIISHPDAGKTTLTETLLLEAGAIHLAGQVKARGETRRARSDWMQIERERGISVTSTVMTFETKNLVCNLLDTPGHEDFSEDTYRTLTAADAAIMVLDAAKGVEARTFKLFEICRLRDIPVITFINKMDREALDPFALLDEVADKLALDTAPLYWPCGAGGRFRGILDLRDDQLLPCQRPDMRDHHPDGCKKIALGELQQAGGGMDAQELEELSEGAELAREELSSFDKQAFLEGHLTPVLWGSALRRFGVAQLLDCVLENAPPPKAVNARERLVTPEEKEVSGFVFRVQANMDLNHRDRVAFVRLCSGEFKRGMKLRTGGGKMINVHNPVMFFAQDRQTTDEAFAGDIIGIPNHGQLRVGDSLSESGKLTFTGLPNFAPEILARAQLKDPLKAKHLAKALQSLAEEGVTQLFVPELGSDYIIGAVGQLQIDVLSARVRDEYGIDCVFEAAPYQTVRWLPDADKKMQDAFAQRYRTQMARDSEGNMVFLAKSDWEVGYAQENFPDLPLARIMERQA